jgi:hypothetical protein
MKHLGFLWNCREFQRNHIEIPQKLVHFYKKCRKQGKKCIPKGALTAFTKEGKPSHNLCNKWAITARIRAH